MNSKTFQTFEGSPFFNLLLDYVELFYDKNDVVEDVLPYLKLFSNDDAVNLREKIRMRVDAVEGTVSLSNQHKLPDIKVVRWKAIQYKLNKLLGGYSGIGPQEKLNLANQMFVTFVQCYAQKEEDITDMDYKNFEDIIVVAIELIHDVKMFDQSVLNPINFIQLQMLEYALTKCPGSKTLLAWQVKIQGKLGLTSLMSDNCSRISRPETGLG